SEEISKYELDLAVVQEVRWDRGGTSPAGESIFYYGKENENYELGTGFFVRKRIISTVERVDFVGDRLSYITGRSGRWCDIVVLIVHAPTGVKIRSMKNNLYDELENSLNTYAYFASVWLDMFKPTNRNESLHEIINDNGDRVVNFPASKIVTVKSTHRNFHESTGSYPDGKNHNQFDHILIDTRRRASVLDVRAFRIADCDTDHHLVEETFREILAVNKQTTHRFQMEGFNLKRLKEVEGKEQYRVEISNSFEALEKLETEVDVNKAWETIREDIEMSAKESLGYYGLKKHKLL
ncbi:hypothetical protein B7P43_G14992, partial [Cryptotermes secundus]